MKHRFLLGMLVGIVFSVFMLAEWALPVAHFQDAGCPGAPEVCDQQKQTIPRLLGVVVAVLAWGYLMLVIAAATWTPWFRRRLG